MAAGLWYSCGSDIQASDTSELKATDAGLLNLIKPLKQVPDKDSPNIRVSVLSDCSSKVWSQFLVYNLIGVLWNTFSVIRFYPL